jgi:hypothetical protein
MRSRVLFLAVFLYTARLPGETIIGATHDATIVQRGNVVIAAVLAPPLICYGSRTPRNVSCKPSIDRPSWKEID